MCSVNVAVVLFIKKLLQTLWNIVQKIIIADHKTSTAHNSINNNNNKGQFVGLTGERKWKLKEKNMFGVKIWDIFNRAKAISR